MTWEVPPSFGFSPRIQGVITVLPPAKLQVLRANICKEQCLVYVIIFDVGSYPSKHAKLFLSVAITKTSGNQSLNFIAEKIKQGMLTSD